MENEENLMRLSKEKLVELIGIYSKNWLALDGVWFQSVEQKEGMDEAMFHDLEAWRRFTVIEAKRIKAFLNLPDQAGTEGLAEALQFRFYANLNRGEIWKDETTLLYRVPECRVQTARKRKGMCFHPCKMVGLEEYSGFARVIDGRFRCECLSCYPEITDPNVCCAWRFTLEI
ncbi:MAG: DUF6125 family protein [Clostridia bacterium]